jgi:NADPH-dependent 2,4-dienoyl-CoA reductase/sulfur reductase-like enzyme
VRELLDAKWPKPCTISGALEVDLIEIAGQVLPSVLDQTLARIVQHHIEEKSVTVHTERNGGENSGIRKGGKTVQVITPQKNRGKQTSSL